MVGIMTRDPMLDLLHQLEHRMGRTFNGELLRASEWPVPEAATTAWLPLVDIFEEPDVIRLVAEVPGVRPEDVKISVEGNLLTIKGTKEQVAEEKAEKVHRYQENQGDLRPRRADDHAAEGGDGEAAFDPGGTHAAEGVERLTGVFRRRRVAGCSPSFSPGEATC
jgi:HSP20 family molecular chaperone IbpA